MTLPTAYVRRPVTLVLALALLAGCDGSDLIGGTDLAQRQEAADDVARTVVAALVADLGAAPPSGGTLGRGLYAGCDGGDADQAAYFIDTFVTYAVRDPAKANAAVSRSLSAAGLLDQGLEMSDALTASKGDITIDLSTQDKGGGSAGQNIYVSTACLAIGRTQIAAFNAKNGRVVTP